MKDFIKNKINGLILTCLCLIFAVISLLGCVNFSSPRSFYLAEKPIENGTAYYDSVCYKVELKEGEVLSDVWVNLGSCDYDEDVKEITFSVSVSPRLSSNFIIQDSVKIANDYSGVMAGRWQRLSSVSDKNSTLYVLISTKNRLKINEFAFIKKTASGEYGLLNAESVGAGKKKSYSQSISASGEYDVSDKAKSKADKLIDEQRKFKVANIGEEGYAFNGRFAFSEDEALIVDSVRNLFSGNGDYVYKTVAPLGQYILGIGTLVFGYNAFGVRFIPLLFSVLNIVMIYLIGGLIFDKKYYGLIASFLFAVCGYSLFYSATGSFESMFAFFILTALYFAVKLYKNGISAKTQTRGLLYILFGGLCFAVAFNIYSKAIFYLIPVAVLFALLIIKTCREYSDKKAKLSGDEVKLKKNLAYFRENVIRVSAMSVLSYVVLTVILSAVIYAVSFNTLSVVYSETDFVRYAVLNVKDCFNGVLSNGYVLDNPVSNLGLIVNYDAVKFTENKFVFGNLALSFVGFFSILCLITFSVIYLIGKKGEEDFDVKNVLLIPSLIFITLFLTGYLFPIIIKANYIGNYYIPVIASCLICASLFDFSEKSQAHNDGEVKVLFKIGKLEITVVRLVAFIVCVAVVVFFALSVSAYLGIATEAKPFTVNVINKKIFG